MAILKNEVLSCRPTLPEDASRLIDWAREEQAWRDEDRLFKRLAELTDAVGPRFAAATLANYQAETPEQQQVKQAMIEYSREATARVAAGQGIVLYGTSGTGKTHLERAAAGDMIRAGMTVRWHSGQELFGLFRKAIDDRADEAKIIRALTEPDVLVVDDALPPSGVLTEYQAAVLYRIVDARYRRTRPTWASLNVAGGTEAERGMGCATVDRLRDGALCLFCGWPSHRKARA